MEIDINPQPEIGYVLNSGENVRLSWDGIEGTPYYLLVLKPRYMWFWPANIAFLLKETYYDLSYNDLPCRDCEIEWFVKALPPSFYDLNIDHIAVALSAHKAPQVAGNVWFTDWTESRFIDVESGEIQGFDQEKLQIVFPQTDQAISETDSLEWSPIFGADAYLIFIQSTETDYAIAVTPNTKIAPPFPEECDFVDGVRGLQKFENGQKYSWKVCAVRVKTGALGFAVGELSGTNPLKIYPRYEHPSGIVIQSQWSQIRSFSVQ